MDRNFTVHIYYAHIVFFNKWKRWLSFPFVAIDPVVIELNIVNSVYIFVLILLWMQIGC